MSAVTTLHGHQAWLRRVGICSERAALFPLPWHFAACRIRRPAMTVLRTEKVLLPPTHRRDEPNLCDDECVVAGHLAPGLLATDRQCRPMARLVALGRGGSRHARPASSPGRHRAVAKPAGIAAAVARSSAWLRSLPPQRVARQRRPASQADLGARQRTTGGLRRDLPLGDRANASAAALAAFAGLPVSRTESLWQDAALRRGHGRHVGMPQRTVAGMVWHGASMKNGSWKAAT